MISDLIYDIGLHRGCDTEFYLKKGFRVVAVDANPQLCAEAGQKFADAVADKRLTILNAGIADEPGVFDFTINTLKDDWSSFDRKIGQRIPPGATSVDTIVLPIECQRLDDIFSEYGIPYYLKVDIEGNDDYCIRAVERLTDLPRYVSVEATVPDFSSRMTAVGYNQFKLISQVWHQFIPMLNPSREGKYVEQKMTGHHSGPFGEETYGPWLTKDEFDAEWARFRTGDYAGSLHKEWGCPEEIYRQSWVDFHASRA